MKYNEVIEMLGSTGKDKITKQEGVISSVCFDLYGCIQVTLTPTKSADGKEVQVLGWFDINRIEVSNGKKIMEHPSFEIKYKTVNDVHGCSDKPVKS